jgi:hypothetical protein
MIAQMQEARAAHNAFTQLRETIFAIAAGAKQRHYANAELCDVLDAMVATIQLQPSPDDRQTFLNEHHYRRAKKHNVRQQERQEIARRMAGVPTSDEALAILHAKNALRRADLPTSPDAYITPKADPSALPDPFAAPAKPSRPNIIFPRDDPDDLPLDFEGEASDSLFGQPKD